MMEDFDYENGVLPDEELHDMNIAFAIFNSELFDLNPEKETYYLSIGCIEYGDDEIMEQYVHVSNYDVGDNLVSMPYLMTFEGEIWYTYEQ